jgi:hypothetical protein
MTAPKLYRIPNTDHRIYAIEEGRDVLWTKFSEDHAEIANLKKDTKQEFETIEL